MKIAGHLATALLMCAASGAALAQDNSFALTIQNGAMLQSNLTNQMINLGGAYTAGGAPTPASCMPPVDLQRGQDGHVPPELQGDPRYQAYLRCKQGGGANPMNVPGQAPAAAAMRPNHLPLSATDYVPARPGHPTVDETISGMDITPEQRKQLHDGVDEMFRRVASQYRGNNVAVAVAVAYATSMTTLHGSQMNQQQSWEFLYEVNDQLARAPAFAQLTAQQKQDEADKLIFQAAIISGLRDEGAHNPQAMQQAQQLSRAVVQQFDNPGAAPGEAPHGTLLGVKVGPVSPAVAAAAGFQGSVGAFVVEVVPGSAAAKAGIRPGDILEKLGNSDIRNLQDVRSAVSQVSAGQTLTATIFRQGTTSNLNVTF